MAVSSPKVRLSAEPCLVVTAVLALLLGAAVYLLERDWGSSLLLERFAPYQWPGVPVFGVMAGCLPSFLHAYAFALLLMLTLWPWPRTWPWACLLWFCLALVLELLQSGSAATGLRLVDRLPDTLPGVTYVRRYALQGRFDRLDLLATGAGCLLALAVAAGATARGNRG